ncbi:hypothetical protein SAMN05428970_1127 [Agromyces sp. CF514]|uniref:hypothetical protein n=1 Tax=Agromyces sp. CF514 TaxID=1881031 RepID=UPI0008EA8A17|nr:hypothetical protein [Agromyces sp. CF514]SFR71147.1 hypothetical protein SAMN05428970_1127 [Agromyces sp. CF514]
MIVDGYRLVRPGQEPEMRAALRARRLTEIGGTALGVVVALSAGAVAGVPVLPVILAVESPVPTWMRMLWPPVVLIVLAFAIAFRGWLLALRIAERRYTRRRDELTRSAYAIYDFFGGIPDVPAEQLWEMLDRRDHAGWSALSDLHRARRDES